MTTLLSGLPKPSGSCPEDRRQKQDPAGNEATNRNLLKSMGPEGPGSAPIWTPGYLKFNSDTTAWQNLTRASLSTPIRTVSSR